VRWLLAAVLVVLSTTGLGTDGARAQARVVAFGDSYVHPSSGGVRNGQRPWVALLGEPVRNLGHAGDGVADTLSRVRRAGTLYDSVVVAVGINDVRRRGDFPDQLASFRRDYEAVLDRLSTAQRVVVVPPLPIRRWGDHGSESVLLSYRAVELSVAALHPNVVVADPLPLWRVDTMMMRDGIHANAAGRALIADTVRTALAS
jgi:lysophospholipase L1-like esterase